MRHHAECQCGQLTVDSDTDPDFVVACNCRACQRRTGAPLGGGLYFPKPVLSISGTSSTWTRTAPSGRALVNHFCPDCGTTVYWSLEMRPDHLGVAYGSFTTPVPAPDRAIWTQEKHDWVQFPDDMPTFPAASPA